MNEAIYKLKESLMIGGITMFLIISLILLLTVLIIKGIIFYTIDRLESKQTKRNKL